MSEIKPAVFNILSFCLIIINSDTAINVIRNIKVIAIKIISTKLIIISFPSRLGLFNNFFFYSKYIIYILLIYREVVVSSFKMNRTKFLIFITIS